MSSRTRITVALVGLLLLVVVGWFVQQRSDGHHAGAAGPRAGAAAYDSAPVPAPSWRVFAAGAPQARPGWDAPAAAQR